MGCRSHFPLLVRQPIQIHCIYWKRINIANWFEFILDYHPVNTNVTTNLTDNTILVNETFSITCSAQANPPAKYRFYKGNEYINGTDNNAVITTSVSERVKMVNYSCIPFNFYGNGTQKATAVTVHCKYLIVWIPLTTEVSVMNMFNVHTHLYTLFPWTITHIHRLGHIVKEVPLSNRQPALLSHFFK